MHLDGYSPLTDSCKFYSVIYVTFPVTYRYKKVTYKTKKDDYVFVFHFWRGPCLGDQMEAV